MALRHGHLPGFFSTQARGRKIGEGLAAVKALGEEADGALAMASAPGKGAIFTLDYPEITRTGWHRDVMIVSSFRWGYYAQR